MLQWSEIWYDETWVQDKQENIYNTDEKICSLSLSHTQEVHPAKDVERLHSTTPKHGKALGRAIPQTAVLYKLESRHSGVIICTWNQDPKLQRVNDFPALLEMNFAQFKTTGIIISEASMVPNLVLIATTLLCWSRNCAHILQPMDISVFGPFEVHYDPPFHSS